MKRALILAWACCLVLTGCVTAAPPPLPETVQVPVPYPVYCEPPDISAVPALPIDGEVARACAEADSPSCGHTVDRALWASLEILEGDNALLRAAVAACRKPPAK